jgi:hypothetical protein
MLACFHLQLDSRRGGKIPPKLSIFLLSGWLAPGRPALWPVQYLQQEPSDLSYGTMKKRNQKERLPAHITEPRNRRSARSRRPVPRRAANIKKKGRGSTRLRLWFGYPADTERRWEHRGEAVKDKEGARCNTRSTFETSRCNTCNIRLRADEILETCIWNTYKNTWKSCKTYTTFR